MDIEIRIIPNSSVKDSEADKINKDITFYQMTAQNPLVDQVKNLKDLAAGFGKDDDIVKEQQAPQEQDVMAGLPDLNNINKLGGGEAPTELL